jgi:uncharacterized protein YuzE
MKITYFSDTDTLYIDLSEKPGADTDEIADGVVVDYDADGAVTGIEIDHARARLDLTRFVLTGFPGEIQRESA